jgi:hypothetical protein
VVSYEQMFGTSQGTIDHTFARECAAAVDEVLEIREQQARLNQRLTEISRRADDRGYWKAAGCSSLAQWLAQITSSDYRTARHLTETAEALRELPALDQAFRTGDLTLDQVAAAAPLATPASDAEIARISVGKAPGQISREARKFVPPKVADDKALYERRALTMTWTGGGRELVFSGRLPLEQGLVFEQAIRDLAKVQRTADKKDGTILGWQQSAADALVTLLRQGGGGADGVRRSPTTLIVHLSDGEPPMLEGAGPISAETAEWLTCDARRLAIKLDGGDLLRSRVGRCASYSQLRALYKRSGGHCQYPGCTSTRELQAHHVIPDELGGAAELANLILLCSRHHKHLHDNHIHTSGTAEHPIFEDPSGRAITANQPHAPPR